MKLKQNPSSIQQRTSKESWDRAFNYLAQLNRPKPPTPEAVAKAQFIDKTYQWKGSAAAKAADVQPSN